jgi:hypothetical protein
MTGVEGLGSGPGGGAGRFEANIRAIGRVDLDGTSGLRRARQT